MAVPKARDEISLERHDTICVVTLHRPQALNAITMAMADRLTALLNELAIDRDTWVVVLTAQGERAFCVGADVRERQTLSEDELARRRASLRRMFHAVRALPQPSIAAVFGYVLGGGFELALACDLIVASKDAVFGLPETRAGLVPAGGGTFMLPRAIGQARAKELIFTGRRIDASEALALGLLADVVSRSALEEAAFSLAGRIAGSSPVATRAAKAAIRGAQAAEEAAAIEAEEEALAVASSSRDAVEGLRAFAEKRAPEWENQ